jgi:uncharacterized protein
MVGIGYRRDFAEDFLNGVLKPDFIEVAPENWMGLGGYWKRIFREVTERYPLFAHGLSLSIGSPDALDMNFLRRIKDFLDEYQVVHYSEHLSFSQCNNAHLYDLLPVPFTEEAINHIAARITQVQDILERKVAFEIASYYSPIAPEMEEIDFLKAIFDRCDTLLLLDVNNVYVNSFNHKYDAKAFIKKLPLDKVSYIHMAGHEQVAEDLIIDTHGQAIVDPVYDLLRFALTEMECEAPILLERDYNNEDLIELQEEINQLKFIQQETLTATSQAL